MNRVRAVRDAILKAFLHLIGFLPRAFGRIQYAPPAWIGQTMQWVAMTPLGRWVGAQRDRFVAWARANPRRTRVTVVGSIAVLVGAWLGVTAYLDYLDSLPKPAYVDVTIEAPREPDLETKRAKRLVVRFSASAARLEHLNKPIVDGISLSPAMKGTWRWASDAALEFAPSEEGGVKEQWEVGREYKLSFSKSLFTESALFKKLSFEFSTPQLSGAVSKNEFYQDPRGPSVKKVVVNLRYNYVIDPEDIKKRITLRIRTKDQKVLGESSKSLPFAVSFGTIQNEVYVQSESIAIPREDSIAEFAVAEGARTSRGGRADKVSAYVDVPGLLSFLKFSSPQIAFARNEKFEPEQIFVIESKADIASETVAAGMKLYLLPKKKPSEKAGRKVSRWSSASEITGDVRAKLEAVKFSVVPSAQENSASHTFKIDVPPGRALYVKIAKGLKSFGGYELANDFEDVVTAPEYPRELSIMSAGSLLTLSGEKKIPLLGRNVAKANFELYRILPTQLNQFIFHSYQQGWSSFSKPEVGISKETLSEIFKKEIDVPIVKASATQYFSLDLEPYLGRDGGSRKGFFYVEVSGAGHQDQRLILVSDLGVITKASLFGGHDVFVQNLKTGAPVAGAQVEVLGLNGLTVLEQKTDGQGRAQFPKLDDFKNEKRPIAFVVRQDGDVTFLPYQMSSRSLDFSKFDVGGLSASSEKDQLSAYLFSDRGIYRPGDKVNLGLMVRSQNWKVGFTGVPLTWSVTDPRGTEVHRDKLSVGSKDLSSLTFSTEETSPTGVYNVQVFIAKAKNRQEQIGTLSVRVEEFLPDRMRAVASLSQQKAQGWVSPENLQAKISLKNLFGTPAEDRRAVAELELNPTPAIFKAYEGFQFAALSGDERPFSERLEPGKTDEKGEASFDLDLKRFTKGMYRLRVDIEGFEAKGGRGVVATASTLVSAWPFLVGMKSVDSLTYVPKGGSRDVQIIAVDPDLKQIEAKDLKISLIERKYVSSLTKQPDGTYKYQSVQKDITGPSEPFRISAKGTKRALPTDQPGEFFLVVKNKADVELNRIGFSVAGSANLTRALDKNAELELKLARADFRPGQEIEMQIKAPFTGAGLITIERDKVYASKWFKTSTTSTVETIKIPEGLEGNAYVNVTFLRGIDSREIFMSPLAYAVAPFSIALDDHVVDVKLDTPVRVRPGETLKVGYSASRATKIVVYGVDEGILQVAKYKLPDPLTFFFQRRALQVATFQLLDLLLPEFSIVQKFSAPGGDGDGALSRNLNPFKRKNEKPVVFWSGVLDAGESKKEYSYAVPDYFNGSIRVMAVASNGAAFGAEQATSISRGDFVISSNAPMFVAPGDEFVVGVGLSNQAEGSGDKAQVKLDIEAESFEIVGPASLTLEIPEGREKPAEFRLRAKAKLGSQTIKFRASAGGKSAKASVETSVRPASPFMTELAAGYMDGATFESPVTRKLLPEFMKQTAALSPIPLVMGHGIKQFLDGYPFGCTEQLSSKLLPYVVLKGRAEFGVDAKVANEAFATALPQLRSRQASSGGFAMYDPSGGADAPVSLYATHVLLEAKDRGFAVPTDVLDRAIEFIESGAFRKTGSLSEARAFAYSLYLLARAGRAPGNDLSFLRKALDKLYKEAWKNDLTAGFVAGTYRLLKIDDEARTVFGKVSIGAKAESDPRTFYDGFVRDAALIMIAARHFPEMLKDKVDGKALKAAFEPLRQGLYSTHSSAWSLLALEALAKNAEASPATAAALGIAEIDEKGVAKALALPAGQIMPSVAFTNAAQKIRFSAPGNVPYFFSQAQSGFDRDLPTQELKKGLEIRREYLDGDGKPVSVATMGETVTVRLLVRSDAKMAIPHLVIVDLLPSGLEPVLERDEISSDSSDASGASPTSDEPGEGEVGGDMDGESDAGEGEGIEGAMHRLLDSLLPHAKAQSVTQSSITRLVPSYVDRREDRVVIYTELPDQVREYTYRAKAVAEGTFVVPPAFGESMYDRTIRYRGVGGSFKVEPAK